MSAPLKCSTCGLTTTAAGARIHRMLRPATGMWHVCGFFKPEPAEPETKDPLFPPGAAPKRLVGEE